MHTKEEILKNCEEILSNPNYNRGTMYEYLFVYNRYQLEVIPQWVYEIIDECCGKYYPHMSFVIFDELMNSISSRKFNDTTIPSDYIITPEDWADCYEDGYPIMDNIEAADNCEIILEYDRILNAMLHEVSRECLIAFIYNLIRHNIHESISTRCMNIVNERLQKEVDHSIKK